MTKLKSMKDERCRTQVSFTILSTAVVAALLCMYIFLDGTGQTYEQTDFFSENIHMEKSFWIYTELIMERLILGIKYEKITKFSLNYRVITIIEARGKGLGRQG